MPVNRLSEKEGQVVLVKVEVVFVVVAAAVVVVEET